MLRARENDIFIAVAAVADWHVSNVSDQKLKKTGADAAPALAFAPNPDILADVAALTDGPWCVGFAAETEHLETHAQAKRLRKGVPLLVGNLAQDVMDADATSLMLFDDRGAHPLAKASKRDATRALLRDIAVRWRAHRGRQ